MDAEVRRMAFVPKQTKKKVEAGCEYLTTQMFFDNNILYNFLYRSQRKMTPASIMWWSA